MYISRVENIVKNDKLSNLYCVIMHSNLYKLQSLICEYDSMNINKYDYLLYRYITESKNIEITEDEFYDTYSRDEINALYIDCIVQDYMTSEECFSNLVNDYD